MLPRDGLIACLDVAYGMAASAVACKLIEDWGDRVPVASDAMKVRGPPADYEPGEFFRRELPLLLGVIETLGRPIGLAVIDGYVWLSKDGRPGLGAHLFEHLGGTIPVIGVAKTRFRGDSWSAEVYRASSKRPLLVTSAGMAAAEAAACIHKMHGSYRVPTILRAVDQAARELLNSD